MKLDRVGQDWTRGLRNVVPLHYKNEESFRTEGISYNYCLTKNSF